MNTTKTNPLEAAMAINTARRVNYLIDRIEYLARMEMQLTNPKVSVKERVSKSYEIAAEMMDLRKELIHLATK